MVLNFKSIKKFIFLKIGPINIFKIIKIQLSIKKKVYQEKLFKILFKCDKNLGLNKTA